MRDYFDPPNELGAGCAPGDDLAANRDAPRRQPAPPPRRLAAHLARAARPAAYRVGDAHPAAPQPQQADPGQRPPAHSYSLFFPAERRPVHPGPSRLVQRLRRAITSLFRKD
jgi:hypothetical protein